MRTIKCVCVVYMLGLCAQVSSVCTIRAIQKKKVFSKRNPNLTSDHHFISIATTKKG